MKLLFAIWGVLIILGAIYWWQLKVVGFLGNDALDYYLRCLVSGGYNNCPITDPGLHQNNISATVLFYIGVLLVLYLIIFRKAPRLPKFRR